MCILCAAPELFCVRGSTGTFSPSAVSFPLPFCPDEVVRLFLLPPEGLVTVAISGFCGLLDEMRRTMGLVPDRLSHPSNLSFRPARTTVSIGMIYDDKPS